MTAWYEDWLVVNFIILTHARAYTVLFMKGYFKSVNVGQTPELIFIYGMSRDLEGAMGSNFGTVGPTTSG